jgi:hypothetical protein
VRLPEKPLCNIVCSYIELPPYLSLDDSQGKANEMTDFSKETDARYSRLRGTDEIIIEARRTRNRLLRQGAARVWSKLLRAVASRPVPAKTSPV